MESISSSSSRLVIALKISASIFHPNKPPHDTHTQTSYNCEWEAQWHIKQIEQQLDRDIDENE